MKRGCLIVLGVLIALGAAAAGGVYYAYVNADTLYGFSEAPIVSHTTAIRPETRLIAVLKPSRLEQIIEAKLPPQALEQLPEMARGWVPYAIRNGLPYEIAILSGVNYATQRYEFSIFANERRGGPLIREALNKSNFFQQTPMVQWDASEFALPQRGVLLAKGGFPIPQELEQRVLDAYSATQPVDQPTIAGEHLAEIVIDNRNGEILAIIGTVLQAQGVGFAMLDQTPIAKDMPGIMQNFLDLRAYADLEGFNVVDINVNMTGRPGTSKDGATKLKGLLNLGLNMQGKKKIAELGLKLDGQFEAEGDNLVGKFKLSGLEQLIDRRIAEAFAAGPAPASAAPAPAEAPATQN